MPKKSKKTDSKMQDARQGIEAIHRQQHVEVASARTGAELVAFFRASPLVGEDLIIERDQSTSR